MPQLLPPVLVLPHVVAAACVLLGAVLARDPPDSVVLARRAGEALWWEALGCETEEIQAMCRALCTLLLSELESKPQACSQPQPAPQASSSGANLS